MSFDLNNTVEITNGDFQEIDKQLSAGKTVIAAVHKGELVTQSLKNGEMSDGFAKVKLKESKANCGTCGCQKPADTLVYLWR